MHANALALATLLLSVAVMSDMPAASKPPGSAPPAPASATVPPAPAAPKPCADRAKTHEFDFWLGEWDVSSPDGKHLGTNSITRDLKGCVIRESWTGKAGNRGTSVNFFDPWGGKWHQVWTADDGEVTHYVGELRDGAMRFVGEGFGDADGVHHHRKLDFIPNPDGSVRQWFQDSDDGKTWTTSFDGIYRRKKG